MTEFIKASDIAAAPAKEDPKSRAEAELYISYKTLIATGRCVQKRGVVLILVYAGKRGKDDRAVAIRHNTGKAAKRSQTLIRRDLRGVGDDEGYNRVIDAVLEAIKDAQEEREHGQAEQGKAAAQASGHEGVGSQAERLPAEPQEPQPEPEAESAGVHVDRRLSIVAGLSGNGRAVEAVVPERSHIIGVGGYNFHHVHDCFNARDDKVARRCRYNWSAHIITGDGSTCPCIPHIDDSNVRFGRKEVFVVHKGRD